MDTPRTPEEWDTLIRALPTEDLLRLSAYMLDFARGKHGVDRLRWDRRRKLLAIGIAHVVAQMATQRLERALKSEGQ